MPLSAAAQAPDNTDPVPSEEVQREYRELAARAIAEFEAGHFVDARSLFQHAHRLWPSARTLRTLGMTAFDLGLYPQAYSELRAALDDRRRPLEGTQREQVETLLERTRDHVGSFALTLSPATADLTVDGLRKDLADHEKLVLTAGEHELLVRAPNHRELRYTLQVHSRQDEALPLTLEPVPPIAATPQPTTQALVAADAPARRSDVDPLAFARTLSLIVGAVGIATGVTAGILAIDRRNVVDRECDDKSQCSKTGLDAAAAGRTWMTVSDLGSAVGVLGISGWLLLPGGFLNGRPDDRGVALVLRGEFL